MKTSSSIPNKNSINSVLVDSVIFYIIFVFNAFNFGGYNIILFILKMNRRFKQHDFSSKRGYDFTIAIKVKI